MTRACTLLLLVAACARDAAPTATGPSTEAPAATTEAVTPVPGPQTVVATLAPGAATPVVRGPLGIWTINPGGGLRLGLSASGRCDDVPAWFSYSGGGVAVAEGQTLCARSSDGEPATHGFSGSTVH